MRPAHGQRERDRDERRLMRNAQQGDGMALQQLFARHLPALRRWATVRVPRRLYSRAEPDDIVQLAFLKVLRNLANLRAATAGELHVYFQRAIVNVMRDEIRAAGRVPPSVRVRDEDADYEMSPEDSLFGRHTWASYQAALATLSKDERACIRARIDEGLGYDEIARRLGKPSAGAARMALVRALERVCAAMGLQRCAAPTVLQTAPRRRATRRRSDEATPRTLKVGSG